MIEINLIGSEFEGIAPSSFKAEVSCLREAVDALCANFPKLRTYFLSAHNFDQAFKVRVGNDWELEEKELYHPIPNGFDIFITAVPIGAGRIGKIILGVGLLALGIAGVGILGLSPLMTAVTGGLLIVGGVLGGKPAAPDPNEAETKQSFIFNGPVNSVAAGGRIPVPYGQPLFLGSYVVSASIRSYLIAN